MKATGIVRKVDDLGRIVLPIELRRAMDLVEGAAVEIYTADDGSVVLRKYQPACIFCGNHDHLLEYHNHNVCAACREALGQTAVK